MSNAKVDTAIESLLNMWESGDMPAAIMRTMLARQAGDRPCDMWSLCNYLIMFANETEDARGFKQWQEIGRNVKKGAKAFYILAPLKKTITERNEETGKDEKKTIIVGFRDIPVFRLEDTEGEPVPVPPNYKPQALPPLWKVAEKWGIKVTYAPGDGTAYGSYHPVLDDITLHTHDVKTYFHELAHGAHNRIHPLKGGQVPFQEIVAETSAAVLCMMYGFEGYEVHARNYVEAEARREKKTLTQAVTKALSDIEKVLNMILTAAEEETGAETA